MRFRQIRMDLHRSEHLPDIGTCFDPVDYVRKLKDAHVDSITDFASCHHGWSYHDTEIGGRHPSLALDLLRVQFDACKGAGINVAISRTTRCPRTAGPSSSPTRCRCLFASQRIRAARGRMRLCREAAEPASSSRQDPYP